MAEYLHIYYVEGGALVEGWRYRPHWAVKSGGEKVYAGLLPVYPQEGRGSYSFVCLAEYSSLQGARAAAYGMLPPRVEARIQSALVQASLAATCADSERITR